MLELPSLASVFVYNQTDITVYHTASPATSDEPPYARICAGLARTGRGALAHTDSEAYPVPGWTSRGLEDIGIEVETLREDRGSTDFVTITIPGDRQELRR